ncbi:hypothetical protein B0H14DRAFT_2630517 [Mycena olivaceomarginata]|nr:hypothetical protein B0H14DRAFT_2630517 [Mycena olivaceomarginata]
MSQRAKKECAELQRLVILALKALPQHPHLELGGIGGDHDLGVLHAEATSRCQSRRVRRVEHGDTTDAVLDDAGTGLGAAGPSVTSTNGWGSSGLASGSGPAGVTAAVWVWGSAHASPGAATSASGAGRAMGNCAPPRISALPHAYPVGETRGGTLSRSSGVVTSSSFLTVDAKDEDDDNNEERPEAAKGEPAGMGYMQMPASRNSFPAGAGGRAGASVATGTGMGAGRRRRGRTKCQPREGPCRREHLSRSGARWGSWMGHRGGRQCEGDQLERQAAAFVVGVAQVFPPELQIRPFSEGTLGGVGIAIGLVPRNPTIPRVVNGNAPWKGLGFVEGVARGCCHEALERGRHAQVTADGGTAEGKRIMCHTTPNVDLQKGEHFASLDGNFTHYRLQDEPCCTTRDHFFVLLPKTDGELVEDFWPKPHNAEATAKPDSDTTNTEMAGAAGDFSWRIFSAKLLA